MKKGIFVVFLLSQLEVSNKFFISCIILAFEIIEEFSTFRDHEHNPTARMIVFFVFIEMTLEVLDTFCQNCNLYFWRSSVTLMGCEFFHKCLLVFFFDCHRHRYFKKIKVCSRSGKYARKRSGKTIWKTKKNANLSAKIELYSLKYQEYPFLVGDFVWFFSYES